MAKYVAMAKVEEHFCLLRWKVLMKSPGQGDTGIFNDTLGQLTCRLGYSSKKFITFNDHLCVNVDLIHI